MNATQTTIKTVSKQSKLITALSSGAMLTEKQIAARFKIANPRATVSDVRRAGYKVEAVRTTTKSGSTTTKYAMVV